MLAGERITESARNHAAEMIDSAKKFTAETRRRRDKGKTAPG